MDSFIRTSANFISQNSEHVRINDTKVKDFCQNMISNSNLPKVDFNHSLHPNCTTDTDFIDWIFIIDSLNFCFWKSPDQPQWTVTYEGITYSGYFALCAALKKAKTIDRVNICDPHVTSKLSLDDFKHILRGDNNILPNLIEERYKFLQENSNILLSKYEGSFENVVRKANQSATKLLELIIEDFPSFRDEAMFLGRKVAFYKRAQILVADLHFCATTSISPVSDTQRGGTPCIFNDIDALTMFADYRVPQVLKYFGILEYSDTLTNALNQTTFKDPDSRFEVELRGNSIEAVERIVNTMNQLIDEEKTKPNRELQSKTKCNNSSIDCPESKTKNTSCDRKESSSSSINTSSTEINTSSSEIKSSTEDRINAITVDVFLWNYRRDHVEQIDREPYHRVVSVCY
uniref:Queuosine 5'-phosphate N-glycosylase/hydrolase n=1 Tax=Cacopsylla melanoneura TaxID=428564 RepID=A0A8D9AC98_9HEMI